MNLKQILYYILVIELTDFLNLNAVQCNTLSISIFGEIKNECTKQTFIKYLSKLLFAKKDLLNDTILIDVNKELSDKLDSKLVGKKLIYILDIQPNEININEILEAGKDFNYLKAPLTLFV